MENSMTKNQVVEAFNKHFMEFIVDIERVFPNDTDIVSTRKNISKSMLLMSKSIIRMYHECFVMHYSNEINNGDLNFFVEKDYRANNTIPINNDDVFEKIDSLREPIKNMSQENKDKIIKYLQNLKQLSDIYNNLRKVNKKFVF
jgi:hypothetical protein